MAEHEDGMWCWCRPRTINLDPDIRIIKHRDIDPSVLMSRYFHGGEDETSGSAGCWIDMEPDD